MSIRTGMSPNSPFAKTMRRYDLGNNECTLWYELMEETEMKYWPERLQELVTHRTRTLGICGEVLCDCVGDWIKGVRVPEVSKAKQEFKS